MLSHARFCTARPRPRREACRRHSQRLAVPPLRVCGQQPARSVRRGQQVVDHEEPLLHSAARSSQPAGRGVGPDGGVKRPAADVPEAVVGEAHEVAVLEATTDHAHLRRSRPASTPRAVVTAFEAPAEQGGEGQELGVVGTVAEPPEGLGAVPDRNGSTKPRNGVGLWPAGIHCAHGRDRAVVRERSDRRWQPCGGSGILHWPWPRPRHCGGRGR